MISISSISEMLNSWGCRAFSARTDLHFEILASVDIYFASVLLAEWKIMLIFVRQAVPVDLVEGLETDCRISRFAAASE